MHVGGGQAGSIGACATGASAARAPRRHSSICQQRSSRRAGPAPLPSPAALAPASQPSPATARAPEAGVPRAQQVPEQRVAAVLGGHKDEQLAALVPLPQYLQQAQEAVVLGADLDELGDVLVHHAATAHLDLHRVVQHLARQHLHLWGWGRGRGREAGMRLVGRGWAWRRLPVVAPPLRLPPPQGWGSPAPAAPMPRSTTPAGPAARPHPAARPSRPAPPRPPVAGRWPRT